ncbi:MAG: monovalent cation/hydrogen antiporter [Frankiales bacterium]|nr:monovalent cation/hydrogen antiporter [Frankiales bacterium]
MAPALEILVLVGVVAVVAGLARRFDRPEPLVLVLVGIALSFVPPFPDIALTPDLVLVGFLPPLLYAAAIRSSLIDFRANKRAIILLSVGLVGFSTVVVGLVSWWVIPGASLAAGMCLGAVVAPPDAVAATAVGRRVGMPRQMVAVLDGESLINDATALVALNTSIAALSGTVSPWGVGWDFLRAAGGGLLVGLAVGYLLGAVRRRIDDVVLDTTLSLAAPYLAFIPAQELDSSGVLAVVVTGLILGHQAPRLQSASPRLAEEQNWRTLQFLLENVVFLLIGLQLRRLLSDLADDTLTWSQVVWPCLAVLVAVIVARVVWIFTVVYALRLIGRRSFDWRESAVLSWAGMRGVVTLAAVFLLPPSTPHRALLALAAFTVVAGTLLVQGLTLPPLVRRLGLRGPDAAEDALQYAALVSAACRDGMARLDELVTDRDPPEVIDELRQRAGQRTNRIWEQLGRSQAELEPPAAVYRRLRLEMLASERSSIVEARDSGVYDDEVLRRALHAIDLEESILDPIEDATPLGDELSTADNRAGDCTHLRHAPATTAALTPDGCEECLRDGTAWVHLRLCLACGHVGCCDSSIGKHATAHHGQTAHPVIRSIEPGEAWRWCYVDTLLG